MFFLQTMCNFILTVKKNYRPVTYHNWRHAFNVAQSMFTLLKVRILFLIYISLISYFMLFLADITYIIMFRTCQILEKNIIGYFLFICFNETFLLLQAGQMVSWFTDLELFVLLTGCLCHDLDHRGTNNQFQLK